MAKNIVFCADGTWNGPDTHSERSDDRTNVYKLFASLDGTPEADPDADEQERMVISPGGKQIQIAKYLHGVGNSDNALVKLLGGSVGAGLITRIVRGYTFISRNYLAGDRIYITGFSRGAYTARALAGLISSRGLIDSTSVDMSDKEHAYRLGLAIWYDYRRQVNGQRGLTGVLGALFDGLVLPYLGNANTKLITHVPIEAVAVWDTVGALGIPFYDHGATLDFFQFTDARLPPAVRTGIHAVALDEERVTFTPSLWSNDPRVTQVLFAGAHSDVGGGYKEAELANLSYAWLAKRLNLLGVLFASSPVEPGKSDFKGMAHRPWSQLPFSKLGVASRVFPLDIRVSQSVLDRRSAGPVPIEGTGSAAYTPGNDHCFSGGYKILPTQIEA